MLSSRLATTSAFLLLIAAGLVWPGRAQAQLSLTSISPDHGATNVGLQTTVTLQFDAAIDTDANFSASEFFLDLEFFPEPVTGEPNVSGDGKTVTVPVTLDPDTQYWVLLSGAVSTMGDVLDRPYASSFTTGSTLPSGSVSGTISVDSGSPTGAAVAVFEGSPFSDEGGDPAAFAVVTEASGAYTIDYVRAGTYNALSLQDANHDGTLEPTEGDRLGVYDANDDHVADEFTLGQGASQTGIDIHVTAITPTLARAHLDAVSTYAASLQADAQLSAVGSGEALQPDGSAVNWVYFYYSASTQSAFGVVTFGDVLFSETADPGDVEGLTTPLPEGWIDSDEAMAAAEASGGADFRAAHDTFSIFGFLTTVDLSQRAGKTATDHQRPQPASFFKRLIHPDYHFVATGAAQETAIWDITYAGFADFLHVTLDAQTGAVLFVEGLATTAQTDLDVALAAAASWQADAALVQVESAGGGVDVMGATDAWAYAFYSASAQAAHTVTVSAGAVVDEADTSVDGLSSTEALPQTWIDSNVAAAVAEGSSNGFRAAHASTIVLASLSRGQVDGDPDRAVWQFLYVAIDTGEMLTVNVDATTGIVIVGTEDAGQLPDAFVLHQNYPNPFNPETNIRYELRQAGAVRLVVYNALGQRVQTLVDATQAAGSYVVSWDGRDKSGHTVATGMYVYRLSVAGTVTSREMMLIR